MSKLTNDFFTQKHLISWVDANFVSFDAKAKAYGEINQFLIFEVEDEEMEYWLEKGWSVIHHFVLTRKERKEVTGENV